MTPQQLQSEIQKRFAKNSEFEAAYKAAGGELAQGELQHQIAGRRTITRGWAAAYTFFFRLWDNHRS
jgi:hypothetical protein